MKYLLLACLAMSVAIPAYSQHSFTVIIKDKLTREPLIGATAHIAGTSIGSSADEKGIVTIHNIPSGKQAVVYALLGYEQRIDTLEFPRAEGDTILIDLATEEGECLKSPKLVQLRKKLRSRKRRKKSNPRGL